MITALPGMSPERGERLMTTTRLTPAFTPEQVESRLRDVREIAARVVHPHVNDLQRDEETLRRERGVPRWLWVPFENGTYLAPLTPSGKRWAEEVARLSRAARPKAPVPYLITPERITALSWHLASVLIDDLQDPRAGAHGLGREPRRRSETETNG